MKVWEVSLEVGQTQNISILCLKLRNLVLNTLGSKGTQVLNSEVT